MKTRVKLSGADLWFFCEKLATTLHRLHAKSIEISKGTDYEFPYKRRSLYYLVQKLGFKYKK